MREVSDNSELPRTACTYLIGNEKRDKILHSEVAAGYHFRYDISFFILSVTL